MAELVSADVVPADVRQSVTGAWAAAWLRIRAVRLISYASGSASRKINEDRGRPDQRSDHPPPGVAPHGRQRRAPSGLQARPGQRSQTATDSLIGARSRSRRSVTARWSSQLSTSTRQN